MQDKLHKKLLKSQFSLKDIDDSSLSATGKISYTNISNRTRNITHQVHLPPNFIRTSCTLDNCASENDNRKWNTAENTSADYTRGILKSILQKYRTCELRSTNNVDTCTLHNSTPNHRIIRRIKKTEQLGQSANEPLHSELRG